MPKIFCFSAALVVAFVFNLHAQTTAPVAFDDYFTNAAIRLEMYQVGDASNEIVTLQNIYKEPVWPENPKTIIPTLDYGRYAVKVYDAATDRLIYVRGFDSMFAEYKTTKPALDGVKRVFEKSPRFPFPKKPVRVSFERRDNKNKLVPIFTTTVDPADYHIINESANLGDWTFDVQNTGDPHDRVDLAFIAEGYTAADKDKFKADVEKFAAFMFSVEPYKSNKDKFNIRGVFRPSPEQGMDQPRQHNFKATTLNASFNAFDLDRYMLIEDSHAMHRIAAQVPYDTIVVLVNSTRYGGGSICLDYCDTTVDNAQSLKVFIHEFGHSFAYLADEYVGDVAYNDFYHVGVEPLEVNITWLLDPKNIKWKSMLTPGVSIPTVDTSKADIAAIQAELKGLDAETQKEMDEAKSKGQGDDEKNAIPARMKAYRQSLEARLAQAQSNASSISNVVGAFEGAGYISKGMYRSQLNCLMVTNPKNEFCAACRNGIQLMINHYTK